jgi:hypothetical protein
MAPPETQTANESSMEESFNGMAVSEDFLRDAGDCAVGD